MQPNLIAGAVSAVILKSRNLPNQKVFAGAALSSVMPGPLGLLIPLVLINQTPGATTGDGAGDLPKPIAMSQVPDVMAKDMSEALKTLAAAKLVGKPTAIEVDPGRQPPVDVVLGQDPTAGTLKPKDSEVVLYFVRADKATTSITTGPTPAPPAATARSR